MSLLLAYHAPEGYIEVTVQENGFSYNTSILQPALYQLSCFCSLSCCMSQITVTGFGPALCTASCSRPGTTSAA